MYITLDAMKTGQSCRIVSLERMAWATVSFTGFVAILLCLSSWQPQNVEAANILGLFTSSSPSHLIVHMSVVKALAERGHSVTVVTAMKPTITHKNIKVIAILPSAEQEKLKDDLMAEMSEKENGPVTMVKMMLTSMNIMIESQFDIMNDPRVTALYNNPGTKFDLVIAGYFMNDFVLGVAAKLNAPTIVDWPAAPNDLINHYVGNPTGWSYVPSMYISLKPGELMNFGKRIQNLFGGILFTVMRWVTEFRMQNYYNKLFPSENFPAYREVVKNVSMVFCNSHFSEGPIRPNVPALLEIGGIQIKDKPDPLPEDIAAHLNASSKHGAIYFCLGSNIKSAHMKPEKVAIIFKVLSNMKQNVIWKWDDLENLPGKSKNILYKKWLPQDDILAHPNVKLFITHAGKGGIVESQYHGVPMVALPIFADQTGNAEKMEKVGYGLHVNMLQLNEAELQGAVDEVLSNPSYRDNVQKFSDLYRDRPLTAKESVVYWSEYVIRHHGAAHMQTPLVHMNPIQEMNLDILALILVVLFITYKLLKCAVKFVCRKISTKCSKSKAKKVKTH